jgi:hypothetical protein
VLKQSTEIHTLNSGQALVLRTWACSQCANVVWSGLDVYNVIKERLYGCARRISTRYEEGKPMIPKFIKQIPGYSQVSHALRQYFNPYSTNPFLQFAAPGHFYSPIPDIQFVDRYKVRLFERDVIDIPGIENNMTEQCDLIDKFSKFYNDLPFKDDKSKGLRYFFQNGYFLYADAITLYSMLRYFHPQRVIEVGSGFSSAVMLDTNDMFLSKTVSLTFIEPYPDRLFSLLSGEDKKQHEIITNVVQDVPIERFESLDNKDILFIDSSHVAKIGSDVVHLLTNVLPKLKKGVLIHFHDIFWPFEYPEEWIRHGRAWNESYFLKAFLQFNTKFKILFFNSYLATHHKEMLEQHLPLSLKGYGGGSLWIQKTS